MSVLLKYTSASTGYVFAIKRSTSDSTLITISINQNTSGGLSVGFLGFLVRNQANTQHNYLVVDNEYNDGKWHHVVARVSGDIRSLFIDGQLLLENTGGMQSVTGNTANATIGSFGSATYFDGSVSSSFFYRRALSNSEVLQNYYQAPIVTDGLIFAVDAGNLVSYENGSTIVNNLSGTQSGTLINGVGYSSGNGGIWNFDGVDDRIDISNNTLIQNLTTNFTIEAIVKFNTSGGQYTIFTKGSTFTQGWTLYVRTGALGPQFSLIGFNTSSVSSGLLAPTPDGGISTNLWYHVVYTYDQVSVKSYINGQFATSTGYTQTFISTGNTPIIGYDPNIGFPRFWNGNIGYISLYNRSLSTSEISQNFNAQRSRFGI
jgi:hypothetical protein